LANLAVTFSTLEMLEILPIVYVISNGLMWRDAPKGYGPHKAIYNRW